MFYDELNPDNKGPEEEYKNYLANGQFMIQQSESTGRYVFYPRICIPKTGGTDLKWVPASGYGTVYAITVNRSKQGNYNVALIDLDEGPRMMSCIKGVETVPIGSRVKAKVVNENGEPSVVFYLDQGVGR